MKRNKGFTISEVMVSIVILGIIGICIINLFVYKVRIDRKTSRNIKISNVVTTIFNAFSSSPSDFITNSSHSDSFIEEDGVWMKSVYLNEENQSNYLELVYFKDENYYTLEVQIYIDDKLYEIDGQNKLVRRIYYGDENE